MFRRPKKEIKRQPPIIQALEARTLMSAMQPTEVMLHSASTSSTVQGYTPAEIRKAYGFDQVSATGAGQTIAIIDAYNDPNIASDLAVFDNQFGLPSSSLSVVNQSGGSALPSQDAGWDSEIALDVEWAHAIAPAANILLVEANSANTSDLMSAVDYARNAAGVSVVSMSWGGSEFFSWGGSESSTQTSYDSYFTTPAGHQGVTFVAASGDSGSQSGVEWPASSPNVLSVGGTTLNLLDSSGTYSSESAWSGTSGGYSTVESEPTYQSAAQTSGARSAPDVAYDADPNTGFAVYDSVDYNSASGWQVVGGTSAGAPQWAALISIADEGRTAISKGTLDGATETLPVLYSLYSAPDTTGYSSYTLNFNDITTGGDSSFRWRFGGFGVPANSATTGYDTITGLGTPKVKAVTAALVAAASTNSGGTTSPGGSGGGSTAPAALPASPLAGSYFKSALPVSVIGNEAGSVKLTLTNTSDSRFSGPVKITLYASTDSSASSDDATIATITVSKITIRSGHSKTLTLHFDYPAGVTAGSYYVIAAIDATATNTATAQAVSSTVVSITPPVVDLAATFTGVSSIKVDPGHRDSATITITNLGNVTALGSLNLALYASTDSALDTSDTLLNTITNRKVKIRAGKSIKLHIHFTAPLGLSGGKYDLIGSVTSFTQPADGNVSNDIAVVGTAEA